MGRLPSIASGSVVLLFILAACATPYQQADFFLGGYRDLQLAPDVFRVAFYGNSSTSQERVIDFALLRAAELASQHGAKYFLVLKDSVGSMTSQPLPTTTTITPISGGGYNVSTNPPLTVTTHSTSLLIRLLHEDPPPGVAAYATDIVKQQIMQRYRLTK